jgi:EAL and modified HD-GYP domain-containing signal transduction protein
LQPLVNIADIVKLDLSLVDDTRLPDVVKDLKRPGLTLLAEKVETAAQFTRCLQLGFDLFQGYHFAKPQTLSARRPAPRKLALLDLLTLIARDATPIQLEAAFKHHPDLSVNLLRLVNSAGMGIQGRISSIRHAVLMLGQRRLHAWLQLLIYTAGSPRQAVPLLQMASVRGRLLEQIAQAQRPWDADYHDHAFLTGAFSLMDTMLDMPMASIVDRIHADDAVGEALLHQRGSLGDLLSLAHQIEINDREAIERSLCAMPDAVRSGLVAFQLEAYRWSNTLSWAVSAGAPTGA